jgi:hypothetical protein
MNSIKKYKSFIQIILVLLLISNCNKNLDKDIFSYKSDSYLESIFSITFDEDIDELVNDAFSSDLLTSKGPKKRFKKDKYGKCASISNDEENNIKTIFFDGNCEGKRGQKRSGTIIINYSEIKGETGSFRQINFDNFYLNDVKIEGTRRYEIISNEDGIQKTVKMSLENGKMIYPDESFSTRSKVLNKEVVYDNDIRFSTTLTGNASGLDSSGKSFEMIITSPIIFLNSCLDLPNNKKGIVPVAGIKTFFKEEYEVIIDFGDGECDYFADITKDGITETIDLRKVHRKKGKKIKG